MVRVWRKGSVVLARLHLAMRQHSDWVVVRRHHAQVPAAARLLCRLAAMYWSHLTQMSFLRLRSAQQVFVDSTSVVSHPTDLYSAAWEAAHSARSTCHRAVEAEVISNGMSAEVVVVMAHLILALPFPVALPLHLLMPIADLLPSWPRDRTLPVLRYWAAPSLLLA